MFRGGGLSGEKQLMTVRTANAGESMVRAEGAEPQQKQGARSIQTKVA